MKYEELNLKIDNSFSTAIVAGKEIKVLKYLPIQDKIDLVQIALQKSFENGIYNQMKLEMYFNLYIVYMYTDLEFTDIEKESEEKLYDELESNHVFLDVIGAMDDDEYDNLVNFLEIMEKKNVKYKKSVAALLATFIQDMPKNAETAAKIVDTFDPEKYKNVVDFAKAANGGRPIN